MAISRSNRPGLRKAGSMLLGRLVAAMTMTSPRPFRPSIEGEELRDDPLFDFAFDPLTLRGNRVDLVEEDDAGRAPFRIFEDFAELASLSP